MADQVEWSAGGVVGGDHAGVVVEVDGSVVFVHQHVMPSA
jgi:hypothetical protein